MPVSRVDLVLQLWVISASVLRPLKFCMNDVRNYGFNEKKLVSAVSHWFIQNVNLQTDSTHKLHQHSVHRL